MKVVVDVCEGAATKRGDLLQTNCGNRRERTCLIVKVHELAQRRGVPRFRVEAVRWWEIEPEFRRLLFRHAERRGGQNVMYFKRYSTKRKQTFEQYMGSLAARRAAARRA